jgi:hypothetical protein
VYLLQKNNIEHPTLFFSELVRLPVYNKYACFVRFMKHGLFAVLEVENPPSY